MERAGKEPLLHTRMFQNRVSNLGLVTQNIQWLVLLGLSFVVSVYLQQVRGYGAIETGLILTPATIGILLSSMAARPVGAAVFPGNPDPGGLCRDDGRRAPPAGAGQRHVQRSHLCAGPVPGRFRRWGHVDLLGQRRAIGFPEEDQGEISGLSRSVSNLGSSLGVAIAGTVIVSQPCHRECGLRPGPDRSGGLCGDRSGRRDLAARTPVAEAPGPEPTLA